jgi:DNA polymerase
MVGLENMEKHNKAMFAHFNGLYAPERKVFVPGDGVYGERMTLVGEAPGEREVQLLKPFVGKAGMNLDPLFEIVGIGREEVYITNVVKFRPVRISEKGRMSNRPPTGEEVALWAPWLVKELKIVKPKLVVTLGNTPLRALYSKRATIGALHGQAIELPLMEGVALFPLYHPASLIYNKKIREVFDEDLYKLKEYFAN